MTTQAERDEAALLVIGTRALEMANQILAGEDVQTKRQAVGSVAGAIIAVVGNAYLKDRMLYER
jgi:hypothetical protein